MGKNKSVTFVFIFLLLIVSVLFFICYKNALSELSACLKQNINELQIQSQREKSLLSMINNSFIYDGISLSNIELVDENGMNGKVSRNSVISNNKLVLFFSDKNCIECIDNALSHLNKWSDYIGKDNIIIIVAYENSYRLNVLKKIKKIKFPIYKVSNTNIPIINLEIEFPFFFVLTNDFVLHNMFVADTSLSKITDEYLKAIFINYFDHAALINKKITPK